MADVRFQPYVAEQATYQSNVFSVSEELQQQLRGDTEQSDWIFRALAGLDASYSLGLQKLTVEGQVRRFTYNRFSELDHDEYAYGARFDWNAADIVDGRLDAHQERRMASFINRDSTDLTLELERQASAGLNVNLGPHWRVESGGRYYELQSPLPEFPDFTLKEKAVSGGLKYRNEARFSTGLVGQYLDGEFSGITGAPRFHSVSADWTVDYEVSELTRLSSQLGATRLRGSDIEVNGFTGSFMYRRQITGISELKLQAFRTIEGYLAGANAVTNTGLAAGVTWQPSFKLRVDVDYTYIFGRFEALSEFSTVPRGRRDIFQSISGSVGYQVLSWMGLRVFGGYRDRDSNLRTERFDDLMFGGEVRLQLPADEEKNRDEDERIHRQPT